MIIIR
jgi:hypothetical protein